MRQQIERINKDVNCVMLDPAKGWYLTHRNNPLGEPVRYHNRWVTLCVPDEGGEAIDIGLPGKAVDSPERVYRARYWPGVRILFGIRPGWTEKLDRALWLGGFGILAFTLFMMMSEMM